jgi:cytochrome P450
MESDVQTAFYTTWKNKNNPSMFTHTDEAAHAAERRLVANAYSLTSLLELEKFVDLMTEEFSTALERFANAQTPVDMSFWMQAYAFDVVGELAFGKAFGYVTSGQDVQGQLANTKEWLRKRFALSMVPWFLPIFRSPIFSMFSSTSKEEKENEVQRNNVQAPINQA